VKVAVDRAERDRRPPLNEATRIRAALADTRQRPTMIAGL
jgi:hypothetical protein